MKKKYSLIFSLLLGSISLIGQDGVGINTNGTAAVNSSALEVRSTDKGMLIPRMALASRPSATSVPAGLLIYNTTDKAFNYSNGSVWLSFPTAYINQIQDKDLDTWVSAEKNPDEDKIRFATGQSGTSVEVAQIDKTGINLNYNGGSEYMYAGNRILSQNKTAHSLSSGAGSFPNTESAALANTAIGFNTLSTSSMTADGNLVAGASAGKTVTGLSNTFLGSSAGEKITSGSQNTAVGKDALSGSVTGRANTVIGSGAGQSATSDSLIVIGKGAGSAVTAGRNDIIIGAGLQTFAPTDNNTIVLGKCITANTATKKVRFHNLYSFPDIMGSNGDLLVLDPTLNFKWGGRVSRQVAGAMADIKPYDIGMATAAVALDDMYFIKVTSFATAELAYIATRIVGNTLLGSATATLELGIFNAAGLKLASKAHTITAGLTGELQLTLPDMVSVTSGEILYLGIYCSNVTDVTFPSLSAALSPALKQAGAVLPATMTLPGTTDAKNIFINAY